jgi:hypothetical protein
MRTVYFEKDSDPQRLLTINGLSFTVDEAKKLGLIEDQVSIFGRGIVGFRFIKDVLSADVERYQFTIEGADLSAGR